MTFKVVVTNPRGTTLEHERVALDPIDAELVPVFAEDEASYITQVADADAIIAGLKVRVSANVIASLKQCKIIQATGIGVDRIDVEAATAAGIPVVNVPDVFTEEVADQAFALLLAVNRKVVFCADMTRAGKWAQAMSGMGGTPKISGKTLGLVAFGNIARAVARRAKGFNLRVLAYDPFVTPEAMRELGVEPATLEQVFQEADFISAHAPHSKATHHIINKQLFDQMKPSAIFINTGRGPVVDEEALIAALRDGKLAGAGLDVLEQEPPDPSNPLLSMPNVTVTPHVAAQSNESNVARRLRHGEEIAAVLTGKRPRNCVNREVLEKLPLA
ncbi:MAG: C-terminal binding protein [Chloroflexi bacterium]|nr:C-terminal binding protein [Chloroflexota bacterium]